MIFQVPRSLHHPNLTFCSFSKVSQIHAIAYNFVYIPIHEINALVFQDLSIPYIIFASLIWVSTPFIICANIIFPYPVCCVLKFSNLSHIVPIFHACFVLQNQCTRAHMHMNRGCKKLLRLQIYVLLIHKWCVYTAYIKSESTMHVIDCVSVNNASRCPTYVIAGHSTMYI